MGGREPETLRSRRPYTADIGIIMAGTIGNRMEQDGSGGVLKIDRDVDLVDVPVRPADKTEVRGIVELYQTGVDLRAGGAQVHNL